MGRRVVDGDFYDERLRENGEGAVAGFCKGELRHEAVLNIGEGDLWLSWKKAIT